MVGDIATWVRLGHILLLDSSLLFVMSPQVPLDPLTTQALLFIPHFASWVIFTSTVASSSFLYSLACPAYQYLHQAKASFPCPRKAVLCCCWRLGYRLWSTSRNWGGVGVLSPKIRYYEPTENNACICMYCKSHRIRPSTRRDVGQKLCGGDPRRSTRVKTVAERRGLGVPWTRWIHLVWENWPGG